MVHHSYVFIVNMFGKLFEKLPTYKRWDERQNIRDYKQMRRMEPTSRDGGERVWNEINLMVAGNFLLSPNRADSWTMLR